MSDLRYSVIVSDKAKKMLSEHIAFLAKVNKDAAKRTKRTIIEKLRTLENFPQKYPFLEAQFIPCNKYRKFFVQPKYLVIYQIKETTVFVDFILDCRKDYTFLIN